MQYIQETRDPSLIKCNCDWASPEIQKGISLGYSFDRLYRAQLIFCRLHADAAYAGVAAMLPEMAQYFDGLEMVESFDTNAHKWLLTNFDCSTLFVRESTHLKAALGMSASYLQNKANDYDYKVRP